MPKRLRSKSESSGYHTQAGKYAHDVHKLWKKYRRQKAPHKHLKKHHSSSTESETPHEVGGAIKSPMIGESNSKHILKYKPMKAAKFFQLGEPTTVQADFISQSSWSTNLQSYNNTCYSFWGNQSVGSQTNSNCNIIELYNYCMKDNSNTIAYTVQLGDVGRKILLKGVTITTVITNDTTNDALIDLYDMIAATTCDADSSSATSPTDIWNRALQNEVDGTTVALTAYGEVPQRHAMFRLKWNVKKRITVELAAGRTHIHKWVFSPNRIVDLNYVRQNSLIKGVSAASMFICKGANLVSASATSGTNIGSTAGLVYYKSTAVYDVKAIYAPPKKSYLYENAGTNAVLTATKSINELSGAVATGTNA